MVRKIYFIIGFCLGFILCAHWTAAREFVQDISPIYQEPIEQGIEKVKNTINETGENLKEKVQQEINKEK